MNDLASVRTLVRHYIGGGWGSDEEGPETTPVAIVRGADFPAVSIGDATGLPVRWEARRKIASRTLEPGDIVLEISGGTKERPTGRTVYVTQSLLDQHDVPTIPASFCRLIRPDSQSVDSRYLYYWLQDMYAQGRTWTYQVQSTGLANFQVETFLDREFVRLPSRAEQQRIAEVLGTFDDLIEINEKLSQSLRAHALARFEGLRSNARDTVPFSEVARLTRDKAVGPHDTPYLGLEHFGEGGAGITGNGQLGDTASQQQRFTRGDILYGRLRPYFRKVDRPGFDGACTGEIWVMRPTPGIPPAFLHAIVASPAFTDFAMAGSEGTKMPRARWEHVARFEVRLPEPEVLATVASTAELEWESVVALREETIQLRKIRDDLLPLLMSGRIRVDDREMVV